ncbi:MAG: hypothetical protein K0U45_03425 [Alphaproteobacteria bacterium]|nr:hypothetical protein [Alphaproteobacteria bacterium]
MINLRKNLLNYAMVVMTALLITGCAGALDSVTGALEDTSIKGEVIASVQPNADSAPKRFVIINGSYGDTLEQKHLLQTSKNPLTKLTYIHFNLDKLYVQQILSEAGWEEVSPEQFLKDKSNVTIITMYATVFLNNKAPNLPPILTVGEKAKINAKIVGKAAGKGLLKKAAGVKSDDEIPEDGDPTDAYYYLVVGAFQTTDGDDSAKRPTELYWQTTAFLKTKVGYGDEHDRDNYSRILPVLATFIKPHLGKDTGGKTTTEWPNQEIAKFKNEPRFYETYKCEAGFFFADLKDLKEVKTKSLSTAQANLERTEKNQSKNKFLASLLAQQKADYQQDIWDNEYGIATVSELIEQKC